MHSRTLASTQNALLDNIFVEIYAWSSVYSSFTIFTGEPEHVYLGIRVWNVPFHKKTDDDCWYKWLVPNREVHKKGFRTRLKKWIKHSV